MNGIIIVKSFSKLHSNNVPNQVDIRQFLKKLLCTWALLCSLEYLIFIPLRGMVLDILRILCYKTLDFEIEKKIIHCICYSQNVLSRGFPGDPMVKTLCSQCRGHGFNPWLEK